MDYSNMFHTVGGVVGGGLGLKALDVLQDMRKSRQARFDKAVEDASARAVKEDDDRHLTTQQLIEGLLAQCRTLQDDAVSSRHERRQLRDEIAAQREEIAELRLELSRCEVKHEAVERTMAEMRRQIEDTAALPVQPVATAVTIINQAHGAQE